ncbi:MAG: histidine/lysine/arginine/ornithine ABC transporter ATP-binding protein, partial [SAR324 cluster bacterium]
MDNRNTALVVEELHKYFGSEEVLKGISLEASE